MKKLTLFLIVLSLTFLAASAMAIDLGGSLPSSGTKAETAVKKVAAKGIEAGINDKLAKKGCAFTDGTTENQTTCNLDQIISDLQGWRSGLEGTIANDVNVHIEASANQSDLAWRRVSFVQDKMRAKLSYWDWYTHKTTANGDKLKIWVSVE